MPWSSRTIVFYYEPGFRSAWFRIEKGQHVNAEEQDQVNPFPSLLIVTAGRMKGRIDGREVPLEKGQALLIPPGVSHEFGSTPRSRAATSARWQ